MITGADDITRLGLDSEFNILVRGSDTMSLGDIMSAGGYAAKITLDNSEFVWSRGVGHLRRAAPSPDIELRGTVVINVADVADVLDAPILQNVSGDGDVYVNAANLDSMYALRGYVDNGSLRVRMMRSTDYVRILGGAVGEFLNGLRVVAPDDKLLAGLDVAATRDELYSIMRRSVRLNPIKLMRPVGIINDMEIMRMDLPAAGVSMGPVVVAGDDFGAYGLRAGAGGKIGRATRFEIFAYISVADYSDDLNVFAATTYGGGARIKHSGEKYGFVRFAGLGSITGFDIGPVFNGSGSIDNPRGVSVYSAVDAGHEFHFYDLLRLAPFAGVSMKYETVAGDIAKDTGVHGGIDASFDYEMDGVRYDYNSRIYAGNRGMLGGEFGLDIAFGDDGFKFSADMRALRDKDHGFSYSLRIGAGVDF